MAPIDAVAPEAPAPAAPEPEPVIAEPVDAAVPEAPEPAAPEPEPVIAEPVDADAPEAPEPAAPEPEPVIVAPIDAVAPEAPAPAAPEPEPVIAAPTPRRPDWMLTVLDVETTGLTSKDRVVSLGLVMFDWEWRAQSVHLVFNPHRKSHPAALRVHGLDDSLLALQDDFADWAPRIWGWLSSTERIVCHNAAFDMSMLDAEMRRADLPFIPTRVLCTMKDRRLRGLPASLDSALAEIGLARTSRRHGALEDAWLTTQVFLHAVNLRGIVVPDALLKPPQNWVAPPEPADRGVAGDDDTDASSLIQEYFEVNKTVARSLVAAGFDTPLKIHAADDGALLAVGGVGRRTLAKLRGGR